MGRGGPSYLNYTALVLLSILSPASAGLWDIDIDNGPAPPPEKGPPFSAHASRDRALLPYQIVGIVGAYVGIVLILGSLLLTVGRKLRKKAQSMTTKPKEMVKPMPKNFEASPISPRSNRTWFSPKGLRSKRSVTSSIRSGVSTQVSPAVESVMSFDNSVIEADRARRQEEMERLYAAAFAQDDQRNGHPNAGPNTAPPEYSGRAPPRLITDTPRLRHLQIPGSGPQSPTTPKSPVRAIYPPANSAAAQPPMPTSPVRAEVPNYSLPKPPPADYDFKMNRHERVPSYGSGQTSASVSAPKKLRKSLRNIKISGPIMGDDNSDGARTPLSPRYYTDPGVPPEPPSARMEHTPSSAYPPETPATMRSWHPGDEHETLDEVRDLPQAYPQRATAHNYNNEAQLVINAASTRPDPTKPANATGNGALPFREMNRQYAQQQQQLSSQTAFPLSPGHWNASSTTPTSAGGFGYLTSAGPVKTTFLEARRDRLGLGPRTGQATPYSPYMPFTPLTPVTPRLTSRAERKQREKDEKKVHGAIMEEDQVADEKDLWSSGY
ncbi:uncharacterized protein LTR77_001264 [Saxophila tyrrhenica]|uniref:Uncharacterized protein n=1 Tax=Saxophila tyrrhenica TaxID=1690608 RepID=A0AAV9PPH7_9PEZI|nr:hypothetical protein LTR77_001264 [Saxophila tyrrhenica]